MTAEPEARDELDVLVPDYEYVDLIDLPKVRVKPLKLNQFLKLMRVITRGGMGMLAQIDLNPEDPEQFAVKILSVVMFAIPEAPELTADFLRSMVDDPEARISRYIPSLDRKRPDVPIMALDDALDDPELEDAMTIIEAVIMREKEDLAGLGKRLSRLFQVALKTGKLDKNETPPADSSATSPGPLTSSAESTGGETTPSLTSQSDDSDRSPSRSLSATS